MSNLPERIKAWPWNNHTYAGQWHVNGRGETTEYVRADLFDAVKAERDALTAENAALKERVLVLTYALDIWEAAYSTGRNEPLVTASETGRAALEKSHE